MGFLRLGLGLMLKGLFGLIWGVVMGKKMVA